MDDQLVWTITVDRPGAMAQPAWAVSAGNVAKLAEIVSKAEPTATVSVVGWARIRMSFKDGVRTADRVRIDEFYTDMTADQQHAWSQCWS